MPDARKLFEMLVREHADMLTIYLRSALGNTPDVDDIFQETMVVAWKRLDDFDPDRPFGPWLRGIARNLVLVHHRGRIRNLCTPAVLGQIESRLDQLASRDGDTWDEKLELLRGCVKLLPDHYQTVVSHHYFQEQPIRQVATSLGLSTAAVKKRLQRARSLVLRCIESKLAFSEGAT